LCRYDLHYALFKTDQIESLKGEKDQLLTSAEDWKAYFELGGDVSIGEMVQLPLQKLNMILPVLWEQSQVFYAMDTSLSYREPVSMTDTKKYMEWIKTLQTTPLQQHNVAKGKHKTKSSLLPDQYLNLYNDLRQTQAISTQGRMRGEKRDHNKFPNKIMGITPDNLARWFTLLHK
jgi:hypothetical protein